MLYTCSELFIDWQSFAFNNNGLWVARLNLPKGGRQAKAYQACNPHKGPKGRPNCLEGQEQWRRNMKSDKENDNDLSV